MEKGPPVEFVGQAQAALQEACLLAVEASPKALDRCGPLLERARTYLAAYGQLDRRNPEKEEAWKILQSQMVRFGLLLENASGFYTGWLRLRGSLSGGYTALGDPAPPETVVRFSTEG